MLDKGADPALILKDVFPVFALYIVVMPLMDVTIRYSPTTTGEGRSRPPLRGLCQAIFDVTSPEPSGFTA